MSLISCLPRWICPTCADARIEFEITTPAGVSANYDEFGLLLMPYDGDHGAVSMNADDAPGRRRCVRTEFICRTVEL